MVTVNIHQAKTQLSQLLALVARGEEVIVARAGTPVARLVPYRAEIPARVDGAWRGLLRMSEDFDAPLPDSMRAAFEGGSTVDDGERSA
jgi:prevent-host-death family protein